MKNRLAAYREAREDLCGQRDQAETDVKGLLMPQEQAILMDMGYLR